MTRKRQSVSMSLKEIFYKEKESCEIPFTHIEEGITNPSLKEIDEIYGAADVLSIKYSGIHQMNLKIISVIVPLIAFLFLLYDEVEQHWLIIACILLIAVLFFYYNISKKQNSHDKYLEYRLLAESLRAQYFLSKSGVEKKVSDILPWFIKKGVPWINEVLLELPDAQMNEKEPILDCWIRDQRMYHESALEKTRKQNERNNRIEKIVLCITILSYIATLIFEIYMFCYSPFDAVTANWNRAALKIIIGTMSVITIFLGNYYGKMSLSSKIDEHRRMVGLYEKAEKDIIENGEESEELILFLAREFLIENSTWYAHQKKNKPDFTVE